MRGFGCVNEPPIKEVARWDPGAAFSKFKIATTVGLDDVNDRIQYIKLRFHDGQIAVSRGQLKRTWEFNLGIQILEVCRDARWVDHGGNKSAGSGQMEGE